MSKIIKFDPLAEINAIQKQFFGDDIYAPFKSVNMPTTDIYTTDDEKEMIVEAHLPDFDEKDINISVDGDYLVVQADKYEKEEEEKKKKYFIRESSGSLYRRIYLPERADKDSIEARFEKGILKIAIPLKELSKPKKINILGKGAK